MTKLTDLVTGTIVECEFVKYVIPDIHIQKSLNSIIHLFEDIDQRVVKEANLITGQDIKVSTLVPSLHYNVSIFPQPVDGDVGPMPVIKQLVAHLHKLAGTIGRHRLNGYFWYLKDKYDKFDVLEIITHQDEDFPTQYKFRLKHCCLTFKMRNQNVALPTGYAQLLVE